HAGYAAQEARGIKAPLSGRAERVGRVEHRPLLDAERAAENEVSKLGKEALIHVRFVGHLLRKSGSHAGIGAAGIKPAAVNLSQAVPYGVALLGRDAERANGRVLVLGAPQAAATGRRATLRASAARAPTRADAADGSVTEGHVLTLFGVLRGTFT